MKKIKIWGYLKKVKMIFKISKIKNEGYEFIKNYKKKEIDMDNLFLSINKSNELYHKMKVKFHPDKHQNSVNYNEIVNYYQEITRSKRDYVDLMELNEKLNKLINNKNNNGSQN